MDPPRAEPSPESLSERLARLFGPGIDPGVALTPGEHAATTTELVQELLRGGDLSERYEVRGEIDRGGMGVVLDVWDRELRRPLAMKVALVDGPGTGGPPANEAGAGLQRRQIVRFLEEAQITSQLDHPGIVPVHELGVDPRGRIYFTMRRVRGRDLREVFHCVHYGLDGWTVTRALGVVLRVCETLAFAHSRNVLHRDLKPANVMVGAYGEVYVMDWGLARVVGPEVAERSRGAPPDTVLADERQRAPGSPLVTTDGDVLGTPSYLAPELAGGEPGAPSARSDVYSLGALLYHLLGGRPPYDGELPAPHAGEVLAALRAGPPRPLRELRPDVAPELAAITEKAMAHDPARRYAEVDELARDLRAWLEGRVVAAHEQGAWAEARKWVLRNRSLSAALAGVLLALAVGLAGTRSQYLRAEERASEARENAEVAVARAAEVLRLADLKRLTELEEDADELWPAHPSREAALRDWLDRAEALVVGLPAHRATLAALRARAPRTTPDGVRFADVEDQWQHDLLSELVVGLERLAGDDPAVSPRADVLRRLEFATSLEERTVRCADAARAWSTASAAVLADPRYGGLALAPQVGLLPLGPDPDSGLQEFAHLASGEPARRGSDGRLVRTAESGVVLVLLPAGTFLMGAQSSGPRLPGHDPRARPDEGPPHTVSVRAVLLSKYELTQAQWVRAAGSNPSVFAPGRLGGADSPAAPRPSLLHPVESVSWDDCVRVLPRIGLRLPLEAEWEYAARAGTTSVWWTGDDARSLEGAAIVAGPGAVAEAAGAGREPRVEDGKLAGHAPVGSLAANPFGLHDVAGNVIEWCADAFYDYPGRPRVPPEPGAGQRHPRRGGGWFLDESFARSACRHHGPASFQSQSLGVRPALDLVEP